MTAPCPTCRGIHVLIAPKFCPACGEQLLELPQATTKATDAEIMRLRAYVEADCRCPFCTTVRHCLPGCTYKDYDLNAWDRMQAARKAMWGNVERKPNPEDGDLDPVYCHRCGDYCSEPRVHVGQEWICRECLEMQDGPA